MPDDPQPMRLWVYRYFHPTYREFTTLDCAASSQDLALASAQRFINRENRRFRRLGLDRRSQFPSHPSFLKDG